MKYPTTKETLKRLQDLQYSIDRFLSSLEYSPDYIELENKNDPDERFIYYRCRNIVDRLLDINYDLEYLGQPVVAEGILYKKENGRYKISGDDFEFTSGNPIEVLIYDDFYECEKWVLTRVEYTNNDYYLYDFPNVQMSGLRARRRGTIE